MEKETSQIMNIYDSILSFHGTWRTYQARGTSLPDSVSQNRYPAAVAETDSDSVFKGRTHPGRFSVPALRKQNRSFPLLCI